MRFCSVLDVCSYAALLVNESDCEKREVAAAQGSERVVEEQCKAEESGYGCE